MKIAIPDMHCGGCLRSVTKAVQSSDPDAVLVGHLDTREIEVATTRPAAELFAALARAGFPATPVA
jgi:copper chaperone